MAHRGGRDGGRAGRAGGPGRSRGRGFAQSSRGASGPPGKMMMGFKRLQDLEGRPPTEVLFSLKTEKSGFKEMLKQGDMFEDKMVLIWSVVAICCRCEQRENLSELLSIVNSETMFTVYKLQNYLLRVQNGRCSPGDTRTLDNVTTFLETLHVLHPSTTLSTMSLVLPILKDTVKAKLSVVGQGLLDRLERLEETRTALRDRYTIQFENSAAGGASDEPTDDFRDIPIFPDSNEVINNVRPFLRPNVVNGTYRDVEHYLDVQFRLLREDFIRPLREGIFTYQDHVKKGNRARLQEIKVYTEVTVKGNKMTDEGVLHEINFPLAGHLQRVQWEHSKRLLFGSLLCFTSDNFETMLFATVVVRDPKYLNEGKLCVRFEKKDILEVEKDLTKIYVMIETEAYFEAYRHVLTVLQEIVVDTFPLKEHIVFLEKQIKPPKYAHNSDQVYCLGRFTATETEPNDEGQDIHPVKKLCTCPGKKVKIHDEMTDWNDLHLGLDHSQLTAVRSALSQSLSIIQGPPGTGKTYVGLKVVQVLLHNRSVWAPAGDSCPIVVVCYTNHALDQFLEGVLKLTGSIVRIGGRSKCDALSQYNLTELRRHVSSRMARDYTFHAKREVEDRMKFITQSISHIEKIRKQASTELLPVQELEEDIADRHLVSLQHHRPKYMPSSTDSDMLLWFWLGVYVPQGVHDLPVVPDEVALPVLAPETREAEENEECDEEIDMEKPYDEEPEDVAEEQANAQEENVPENQVEPVNVENLRNAVDMDYINEQRMVDGDLEIPQDLLADQENQDADQEPRRQEVDDDGWQRQGGKKQQRKAIHKRLRCSPMTEVEVGFTENVWSLKPEDRWRLYRYWLNKYTERREKEVQNFKKDLEKQLLLLNEVKQERERIVVNDAHVVGLTTTGAAKFKHLIRGMRSKIVIVEEAAEVLEAHIVTALSENTQHLILIGDHQQLRPNPTVYELAKKYNLEISLFERLIQNGLPFTRLGIQHRMKPCISKLLVPHIYNELEDHPSVFEYQDIKGMDKSMFFLTHTVQEYVSQDSNSRVNTHEIDYLVELCRYLMLQGYQPARITVLTTYLAQLFMLKRRMVGTLKEVRVSVVDNFQGEECDIILLSFVRSNEEGQIGFLKADNRVCVALSRAKHGLYCIGNFELLASQSRLWQKITAELYAQDAIGDVLNVKCQNHGNLVPVKVGSDFFQISDGGCLQACDYRLLCGHVCSRKCHPDNQDHKGYKCLKPCEKMRCSSDHACSKRCFEACGDCDVLVEKVIPTCEHKARIPCFMDPAKHVCQVPCPKILECEHACPRVCGALCGECRVLVSVASVCGHQVRIQCRFRNDTERVLSLCTMGCEKLLDCGHNCPKLCGEACTTVCRITSVHEMLCGHRQNTTCQKISLDNGTNWTPGSGSCGQHVLNKNNNSADLHDGCRVPCRKELACGHLCPGNCGECLQGRIHASCRQCCGKILACGHPCRYPCGDSCPPCTYWCENRCVHSKCTLPCGYPCTPCMEPCAWSCKHYSCTRRCSEPCDRPPCNRPCYRKLRCGHKCIGMCGEPCPNKCRVCHRREVTDIFFGDEDHRQARFLQLEDCGHIFEIKGFTHWIREQEKNTSEIKLITCPLCRRPLRKNLRYNNTVKMSITLIEKIKSKVFGIMGENLETVKRLRQQLDRSPHYALGSESLHDEFISTDPCSVLFMLGKNLSDKRMADQGTLSLYENYIRFVEENEKIVKTVKSFPSDIKSDAFVQIRNYIGSSITAINRKMLINAQRGSDQLLGDMVSELRRLTLAANFLEGFKNVFRSEKADLKGKISESLSVLLKYSAFRDLEEHQFKEIQAEIKKLSQGMVNLGITDQERISIVKAMGLKQGHWYSCPNGHVYCITECGGAMIESKCNECGATIGGGHHRLRGDNRVATAMDGARHSAWSGQANMGNYQLD